MGGWALTQSLRKLHNELDFRWKIKKLINSGFQVYFPTRPITIKNEQINVNYFACLPVNGISVVPLFPFGDFN